METFSVKLRILHKNKDKLAGKTLSSILGSEIFKYYDGPGGNEEVHDWFFFSVPKSVLEDVKTKVEGLDMELTYHVSRADFQ